MNKYIIIRTSDHKPEEIPYVTITNENTVVMTSDGFFTMVELLKRMGAIISFRNEEVR